MKHIKAIPAMAVELPSWPESHTCDFLKDNLPQSGTEVIDLICTHVKAIVD